MAARQKLNEVAFVACLILAAVVGTVANSWFAFLGALVVAFAAAKLNGTIRFAANWRRGRSRKSSRVRSVRRPRC